MQMYLCMRYSEAENPPNYWNQQLINYQSSPKFPQNLQKCNKRDHIFQAWRQCT